MRDRFGKDVGQGGQSNGAAEGGPDRRDVAIERLRRQTMRANRWHAQHPELVAEFLKLTNNACAEGESGIAFRSLRMWQIKNGVSPADGLLGPATLAVARNLEKAGAGAAPEGAAAGTADASPQPAAEATTGGGTKPTPPAANASEVSNPPAAAAQANGPAATVSATPAKMPETAPPGAGPAPAGPNSAEAGTASKPASTTAAKSAAAGDSAGPAAAEAADVAETDHSGELADPSSAAETPQSAAASPVDDKASTAATPTNGYVAGADTEAAGGGHADLGVDELHLDGVFGEVAPAILQSKGLELPDGAIEMIRPLLFDAGKLRKELFDSNPKAAAAATAAKKHAKGGMPPRPVVVDLLEAVMAPHAAMIRSILESLGGGKKNEAERSEGAGQHEPAAAAHGAQPQPAPADAKQGDGDPKKLLETSRQLMGEGDDAANWGTAGSVKGEGLQHPALAAGAAKGGYEGSFKCNIFVGEALYRSGFMSPGAGEDRQPTHHYADVNDIASDIEVVAQGGKPKHGMQWFDVIEQEAAQPGDILVIRGKWREDVVPFMKSGDENHGHIEILSDVQRDDGSAQIRHIKTIGAGSKEAHEQSHDKRTTFGEEERGKFTFNKNAWVIRPRIR